MDDLNFFFRVLALSQALLLGVCLLASERHRLGVLAATCAFAFSCYLMAPFAYEIAPAIWLVCALFAIAIPSLLWLLAYWFFYDARRLPYWLAALTVCYVAASLAPLEVTSQLITHRDLHALVFVLAPQLIKLLLVIHVVYMALAETGADLVDARRRMRKPIAGWAGALAGLVIIVEIWSGDSVPILIETLGSVLMFVLIIAVNVYLLRLRLDLSMPESNVVAGNRPRISESEMEQVTLAMTRDRLYAEHGLTLTDLAAGTKIPVHRLREIINKGLGHRNFNQFLNRYRIDEAARRLRSEQHLPILTIALDVGFKSLSSFNAAFRQAFSQTPSEYRGRND